jgi:hypothetical protein
MRGAPGDVFTRAAVLTAHAHRRESSYGQRAYALRKRAYFNAVDAPRDRLRARRRSVLGGPTATG